MKYFVCLISFILGFILLKLELIVYSIILLVFLFLFLFVRKPSKGVILKYASFALIGVLLYSGVNHFSSHTKEISNTIFVVKKAKSNYVIISNYFSSFYAYEKNNSYDEGDILMVSGKVSSINSNLIESQFDFKSYLDTYLVKKQLYFSKVEVLLDNPFSKKDAYSRSITQYNDDAKFILSSMFFNQKDYDSSYMDDYKNINMINLLSNSGMFFNSTINFIILIFSLKLSKKNATIISLLLTFPMTLFNPFSFGILRVFYLKFFNLLILDKEKFRHLNHIDKVSIVSLIFLFLDPTFIFRLEFLLSAGLSIIYVLLLNLFSSSDDSFKAKLKTNLKIKLLIFIFFIPINLSLNNSLNPFNLTFQILLIPVFKIYYFIAFFSFACCYNVLVDFIAPVLNGGVKMLSDISFSLYAPGFNSYVTPIIYLAFILIIYFMETGYTNFKKYLGFAVIFAFCAHFAPFQNLCSSQVFFINIGQGDSILIRDQFTSVLIDTGGLSYLDTAKDSLIPFFKKNRIYNIDTVFISHDDFDHSGGLESLKNNFNVKKVITQKEDFPYVISNLEFINLNNITSSDANESSLVLYLKFKDTGFLFMGDAPKTVEENIVRNYPDLDVDILKVGHHGSNTSTSEIFVSHYSPKEAIISCGVNNRYKHPHKETIATLKKYNVKIRRTDLEGTIIYNL